MSDIPPLSVLVDWIESHEKTVDLLKWLMLIAAAWVIGIFRFLRAKLRRPSATLEEATSRCLIEEFAEFQGHRNVVRATFLIEVGLLNPTNEKLVIRHFSLAVPRRKIWRRWKPELVALSLPSRPRVQMGGGQAKLLKSWFSHFSDDFRDLTLLGKVDSKEHHSGFLLFVCFAAGTHAPAFKDGFIQVKAHVHLTTGETCSVSGRVRVTLDKEKFEQSVPGIIEHISHESAWGTVR